ncbi:pseudouridine synthase [Fibrella arboris]|uniref:pseudouridine synthase n=1 Tax=Fibrella arboris TaxID=3242486 RepID=UPI0035203311
MKRDKDSNDRRDGKGRPEGRRDDARGGFNTGGSRPSFGGARSGGSDRPAYGDKKPFTGGDRRESGSDRPAYGDRKPFSGGDRRDGGAGRPAYGDRKPFSGGDRRDGGSDRPERKPFNGGDRRDGGSERPAYGDRKPFNREGGRDGRSDRSDYGDRSRNAGSDAPRKPFTGGDRRDGGSDRPAYGDRKPFSGGDRRDGDRPAYGDRKPFTGGDRRESGSDRPAYGDRPERKPFTGGDRRDGDRPAYGDRTERKPFAGSDRRDSDRSDRKPFTGGDRRDGGPRDGGPRDGGPRDGGPRDGNSARFDRRDRTEGSSDERSERKPFNREGGPRDDRREGSSDRSFERKPFSGGDRRDDSREERPRFDRRSQGDESGERPARKPFDGGDRRDGGPRDARPRTEGPRKPFNRSRTEEDSEKPFERRTGRYEKAPNYNMNSMRENLPRSRKVAKNLERESDPNSIRLNRYIANAGVCSRREADELIAKGDVQVNGVVVTEMGYRVKPNDVVKYGNKVLNPEKLVYVLLNKPRDIITTTEDPEERSTVLDLVADAGPFRLYPVGRLDRNTTGLLLLTNDGELAGKLTHPSNNVKKVYQVELDKPITEEHFEAIRNGLDLEDGHIKPDDLAIVTPDAQVVGVEIHSGRNRIVRRMFESLGYEVTKLDRTVFAGLTKKELPRGKWRFLEPKEVVKLKYLI